MGVDSLDCTIVAYPSFQRIIELWISTRLDAVSVGIVDAMKTS